MLAMMSLVQGTWYTGTINNMPFFPTQRQDVRSLALFRILLGCYILYDVYTRLQHGRLSLAWYTSTPATIAGATLATTTTTTTTTTTSFLHPNDTPHKNPVHLIWFFRGSEGCQLFLFGLTTLLALMYTLGYSGTGACFGLFRYDDCDYKNFVYVKILLWLNVTAMQCRNMYVHDGSDTFTRHLLLWSCFLPMNRMWSLDSYLHFRRSRKQQQQQQQHHLTQSQNIENKIAVWGIRMQIVFMYLGTVLSRTTDRFGYTSLGQLSKSEWLPPSLDAVHYSLNASFSTRDCWLGDVVRNNISLSKFMTLTAMLIEGIAPILCIIMGVGVAKVHTSANGDSDDNGNGNEKKQTLVSNERICKEDRKYAHVPPLLLFQLHFGLLLLMNLPNWQYVGMLATTIWIPTSVWDNLQRQLSIRYPNLIQPPPILQSTMTMQKKDIPQEKGNDIKDESLISKENTTKSSANSLSKRKKIVASRSISRYRYYVNYFFTYFFFIYMIYNFAGERKWIVKHDGGDVGEFLRFSQFWVMFSAPPKSSIHDIFTGTLYKYSSGSNNDHNATGTVRESEEYDVWRWIKNREFVKIDLENRKNQTWTNMTHVYPSPRMERLFSQWSDKNNRRAMNYFLQNLCIVSPFDELTFTWQHLEVLPPSLPGRYRKSRKDTVFNFKCSSHN